MAPERPRDHANETNRHRRGGIRRSVGCHLTETWRPPPSLSQCLRGGAAPAGAARLNCHDKCWGIDGAPNLTAMPIERSYSRADVEAFLDEKRLNAARRVLGLDPVFRSVFAAQTCDPLST